MGELNRTVDLTKFFKNKIVQAIINILLGISAASVTLILLDDKGYDFVSIVLPILSFAIVVFAAFKFKILRGLYGDGIKKIRLAVSIILGMLTSYLLFVNMQLYVTDRSQILILTAIPFIVAFLYWFYGKFMCYMRRYIKTMDKVEKWFFVTAGIILIIAVSIIDAKTTVFTQGLLKEQYYDYDINVSGDIGERASTIPEKVELIYTASNYDIIYTTDTPILLGFDVFSNVTAKENDYKNPLYGVFSIPFSIVPKAISLIIPAKMVYPLTLSIVHGALVLLAFTLLARLMKLNGTLKALFLVFISVAFPSLLFLTNLEQYVLSVFYLIVFIYMVMKKEKDMDMAYIMATGSTTTTGILFPLLMEKGNIKQGIKNVFYTFLKCMAIFIISARIMVISPNEMELNADGVGKFSNFGQVENINKYTNFAQNILASSKIEEKVTEFANKKLKAPSYTMSINADRPCIRGVDTDKTNFVGIAIIGLTLLGFILNRKDKFMQICFAWVLFSMLLLGVMGWGVPEDGLVLYSFYFAWAFICLIFKGIEKMLAKVPKIRNTVYGLAIATMLVINVSTIVKMVQFGIKYYS